MWKGDAIALKGIFIFFFNIIRGELAVVSDICSSLRAACAYVDMLSGVYILICTREWRLIIENFAYSLLKARAFPPRYAAWHAHVGVLACMPGWRAFQLRLPFVFFPQDAI